ncbi:phosphatase PAP2 family protein [Fibrella aquatilis]|uniref:Phosphatase PAP2 family protein n=1 Tax=Fibrella aquatilis TaxID=2817059 RepID=A0A939G645_9BACT|nr:phosphatase PAP2 family protein [Fibrella aquatilis]MBO0933102.1 phosphatase PAP2 family protein [Fibrella aquatilis]
MKTTFTLLMSLFYLVPSQAQVRPTSPAMGHYLTLAVFSKTPNPARAALDTVRFRMQDASKGSFVSTRLRGVYLPTDVPALLTVPTPPANSSDQTRAELDFMLDLQAKRTPEQVARYTALAAIYHSPTTSNPYDPDYARNWNSLFHVGSPLGNWYTHANLPLTATLLTGVYQDATYYFFTLKYRFMRPRPYALEPGLAPVERPGHPAYPSGHSAASYANAYVMSELAPDLAPEFLKMAAEMAYSREVIGVHYPSDSDVSRVWARRFVNELMKQPKFRADLAKAKAEITAKRLVSSR